MTLPEIVVIALAGWRLAYMLVKEDGPGHVFAAIRRLASVRKQVSSDPSRDNGQWYALHWWGDLFLCVYCMSIWTAAVCYGLSLTAAVPIVYILAASGLAVLAHQYIGF